MSCKSIQTTAFWRYHLFVKRRLADRSSGYVCWGNPFPKPLGADGEGVSYILIVVTMYLTVTVYALRCNYYCLTTIIIAWMR